MIATPNLELDFWLDTSILILVLLLIHDLPIILLSYRMAGQTS